MRDFTISSTGCPSMSARELALRDRYLLPTPTSGTVLLTGSASARVAATAISLMKEGRRVVLLPAAFDYSESVAEIPPGVVFNLSDAHPTADRTNGEMVREGWHVAMLTSGSTGSAKAFGLDLGQLSVAAIWYSELYGISQDSAIVTCLPASYNFTFIAGVHLAATTGSTMHFSRSPSHMLNDANMLAEKHDRVVVLGNPVVLELMRDQVLPANVLVDSGGAPLSVFALTSLRERGIDVREGYGLTETGSLTHFDREGTASSAGTVGAPMAGVSTKIVWQEGNPTVSVKTPVTGVRLNMLKDTVRPGQDLVTGDIGHIDERNRLRILGRQDDHQIGGHWPRDTLDLIGPDLGKRCASIRHPTPERVSIRLLFKPENSARAAILSRLRDALGLSERQVVIEICSDKRLLHSQKIPRSPSLSR